MNLLVTVQEGGVWLPAVADAHAGIVRRLDEHLRLSQPEMHVALPISVAGSSFYTTVWVAAVQLEDGRRWNSRHGWLGTTERFVEDFGRLTAALSGVTYHPQGPSA